MMHVSVNSNTRRRQQPLNGCSTPCWAIRAGRETGYCRLAAWPGCQCFNHRCSAGVALPVRDFYFFIGYFYLYWYINDGVAGNGLKRLFFKTSLLAVVVTALTNKSLVRVLRSFTEEILHLLRLKLHHCVKQQFIHIQQTCKVGPNSKPLQRVS